jgi:hypothetical protein
MKLLLVVLALALPTPELVLADRADLIEINHVYDESGRGVLDQLIFWDYSPSDERFHVVAWRLLKSPEQRPVRDWRRGDYVSRWHDGDLFREVRAPQIRETWSQYDPELLDRALVPPNRRRDLVLPTRRPPRPAAPPEPPPPVEHR